MEHHLAGATIQVENLVNYNCHPLEDGNKISSSKCKYIGFHKNRNKYGVIQDCLIQRSNVFS